MIDSITGYYYINETGDETIFHTGCHVTIEGLEGTSYISFLGFGYDQENLKKLNLNSFTTAIKKGKGKHHKTVFYRGI